MSDRKLVLLTVDGSDQSMEVVKYVSKAVNLSQAEVVLLSVIDRSSDIFWDSRQDRKANKHLEYMQAWEQYKREKMQECMDNACNILEQAGVPRSTAVCRVEMKKEGIARDILCECKYGYSVVAIGRCGLGKMDESMLGSIAAKVFINVVDSPVCLLGGKPKPGKVMIGLDNSVTAIRAVNFVGQMLSPAKQVSLVHISRVPEGIGGEADTGISKILDEEKAQMERVFERAINALTSAGFPRENITHGIVQGSGSRAVNLYNEAKKGDFDTLVVGRKGVKDVQDFTVGRMSYKLGYIARDLALWVVP